MGKKILFIFSVVILLIINIRYNDTTLGLVENIDSDVVLSIDTYNSERKPARIYFSRVPDKVIVTRLNTAETLLALGVEDKIKAINMQNTDWDKKYDSEYEAKGKALAYLTYRDLTREEAIMMTPDFMVGWASLFDDKRFGTTEFWNKRHVPTYIQATSNLVKPYATVEDECQFIEDMGRIFHVETKARMLINKIHIDIANIQEKVKNYEHPKVMVIEFSGDSISTYGEEWLVGDLVKQAKGHLLCSTGHLSYEDLVILNPDVIFIVYFNNDREYMVDKLIKNSAFKSLDAVKNRRYYPIRLDYMYATGVRTAKGIDIIAKGLYPQLSKIEK